MRSAYSSAIHPISFAKRASKFAATVAALCVAGVSPLTCWGQWTPSGSNVSLNPAYSNVGIGTNAPLAPLQIKDPTDGAAAWSGFRFYPAGASETRGHRIVGFLKGGLWLAGSTSGSSYALSNIFLNDAGVSFGLSDGYSDPAAAAQTRMVILNGGNVGIGTTVPPYKLSVKGTIGAKEVIVMTTDGWPDYVFHPAYRLKPLSEVDAYIARNHHLPDIPSAAEVRETGISLGDMQSKLLAKLEELTLHAIQSERRNNRLEQENRELQERVARLESRDQH